jgi:polyisoprenoid-binding protein YceI
MRCESGHRHLLFVTAWAAFLGLLLTCVSPNVNAEDAPASTQQAATPTYHPADVQIQASRVYVFVDKTGFGHQHGVEAKLLSSTLVLGADQNAGKLVFDMTSFDADTPVARQYVGLTGTTDEGTRSAVNNNMKGSSILDVATYPTATFDVVSALATGQASSSGLPIYQLQGDFTLHGTTRPLTVTAEVEQARGWLHVRGNFVINQTSFGITPYSKAFGAIGVADPLKIYGDIFVAPTDKVAMSSIPSRQ